MKAWKHGAQKHCLSGEGSNTGMRPKSNTDLMIVVPKKIFTFKDLFAVEYEIFPRSEIGRLDGRERILFQMIFDGRSEYNPQFQINSHQCPAHHHARHSHSFISA
jgi:hypothetical protein